MDAEVVFFLWSLLLPLRAHVAVSGMEYIPSIRLLRSTAEEAALKSSILKLFAHIKMEFNYDHIVLWRNNATEQSEMTDCIFEDLMKDITSEPVLVDNHGTKKNILSKNHSRNLLILSCWQKFLAVDSVEHGATEFPFNSRHLIWVQDTRVMKKVCAIIPNKVSFRHMVIDKRSLAIENIRTCNEGEPGEISFHGIRGHFQREYSYLKGLPIVTESDQLPPRSILYYDDEGNLQLDGFVGHCIKTFAQRYEAKLIITPPVKLQKAIHYALLENKTYEGLLDLPACVGPLKPGLSEGMASYPLDLMEYCYMIPLPRLMETSMVFTYIVQFQVMIVIVTLSFLYGVLLSIAIRKMPVRPLRLVDILLNDKSIRGLLGQSFVMPAKPSLFMQYVCFLLCHTSLIIVTTYEAFLQSHLIHPALGRRVETFADMREAGLHIAISSQELHMLPPTVYGLHQDLFKVIPTFDDFLRLRATMDSRYVFPVSYSRWQVFKQQQQLFQYPIFYYTTNVCLIKLMPLSVPFRPDLPYKALFNQHLLDLRDTGLMQYWLNDNFYAMVRFKYMRLGDLSTPQEYADAIELKELWLIWALYAALMVLSLVAFLIELAIVRYTRTKVKP